MKATRTSALVLIITTAAVIAATVSENVKPQSLARDYRSMWARFKLANKLTFQSPEEDLKRYHIFKSRVSELDALRENPLLALKEYSEIGLDLIKTDAELGYTPQQAPLWRASGEGGSKKGKRGEYPEPAFDISQSLLEHPAAMDYRDYEGQSYITPIKYQGHCGTCWSFAATAAMESAYWLNARRGEREGFNFSNQQLLDCNAFGVVETGRSIYVKEFYERVEYYASYEEYPYTASDRGCKPQACREYNGTGSWVHIPHRRTITFPNKEEYIIHYLNSYGPVIAGIFVNTAVNSGYRGGVINRDGCRPNGGTDSAVNHAVLIVGYGTDNATGVPYWTIKNSHGTWNDDAGYVKYMRGEGVCNIDVGNVTYGVIELRDCPSYTTADACNNGGMGCLWCAATQRCHTLDLFSSDYYEANCKPCSAYTPQANSDSNPNGDVCPSGCSFCTDRNVCADMGACPDPATATTCVCTPADGPCCDGCHFRTNETLCRRPSGPCEEPGRCTGNSAACPAPSYKPSTTVCRRGLDDYVFSQVPGELPEHGCDVTEYCTGTGPACPPDDIWTKEASTFYDLGDDSNESAFVNGEFGNLTGYSYCLNSDAGLLDSFGNKYGMCRAGRCVHTECYDAMNQYTSYTGWFNMECCVDGNYLTCGLCKAGRCVRKQADEDEAEAVREKLRKSENKVRALTVAVAFLAVLAVVLVVSVVVLVVPKILRRRAYDRIDSVDMSSSSK